MNEVPPPQNWEVSLHHGPPEGTEGDVVNELGYDGYARQIYNPSGSRHEIKFAAIPPEDAAVTPAYWALIFDGRVMAYRELSQSVAAGDVITIVIDDRQDR